MIKFFVFVIGMSLSFLVNAYECQYQKSMDNEQWYNVSKGYFAAQPHGYGLTLAAIIIKETQGGLYRVNPESKDYGLTQINIKTAVDRLGYEDTPFMRSVAASKIVFDDDLAIALAIEELLYWDKRRGGDWKTVVASYNDGTIIGSDGWNYYRQVAEIVQQLKRCFKE